MSILKVSTFFVLIAFLFSFSNKKEESFKIGKEQFSYEKTNNRFNGTYSSYYSNGQMKSSGFFENNYRTGVWTIWDKDGNVKLKREYISPFTFRQLIPANGGSSVTTSLKKNEAGFIDYYDFKQEDIAWSKRIWRNIPVLENPTLFDEDILFKRLFELGLNGAIQLYTTDNDEFRKKAEVSYFSELDLSNSQIIAYEIKEESFYDKARQVSETRIIGICPIIIDNTTKKKEKLFWVYYPEVRVYLAQEKIEGSNFPTKIQTVEDVFFYRCFYGQIVKESNAKNLRIAEYKKTDEANVEEATKIDLKIIEAEHDLWLNN